MSLFDVRFIALVAVVFFLSVGFLADTATSTARVSPSAAHQTVAPRARQVNGKATSPHRAETQPFVFKSRARS